jgi:shikimate dehydrogenase
MREQEIPANNLVDIIYNPEITTLMLKYSIKGANVVNGLMMLVAQAIKSEEIWNEKEFSDETFIEIYEKIKSEMYKKVK